jgi:outer membrane protein TolC
MEYLPDFRVRIEHLRANGQSMGKNIAFEANLPLWFWRQGAGVSEAQAMVRMKEAELEAMRNMTMSDIREQYVKAESKKRLADLYQDTVLPLAEQSLKSSRVGYETGRVGFLELLDSQRMLRESQLEYYESEVEFGMAIAELERIVGTDLQGGGP